MPSANQKKFCFKHANPEHKKRCIKCSKIFAQIHGGFCRGCFGGKQKVKEALKCVICNVNAAHRIGGSVNAALMSSALIPRGRGRGNKNDSE